MQVKKIYLDLDGVMADFDKGVEELAKVPHVSHDSHDEAADAKMWEGIRGCAHFYDALDMMPGAQELFEALYKAHGEKCEVLTGIPKPRRGVTTAGEDKINWVHRMLHPDLKVNIVFKEEKVNYCTGKDCILIDDLKTTIDFWNEHGGTGIQFLSAEQVMGVLKEKGILQEETDNYGKRD